MSLNLLFWILVLLCVLFGAWPIVRPGDQGKWPTLGYSTVLLVLVILLGWKVFGAALHD